VIPEKLVMRIPRTLIERHEILPLGFSEDNLVVATFDPFDFDAIDELQLALGYKIEINLAPRSAILRTIDEIFKKLDEQKVREKSTQELLKELEREPLEKKKDIPKNELDALVHLLIKKGIITRKEFLEATAKFGRSK
jgi:type II secretory ATPase GspE/PulE/Tfp pilus assembly ATPase PilB-like protein